LLATNYLRRGNEETKFNAWRLSIAGLSFSTKNIARGSCGAQSTQRSSSKSTSSSKKLTALFWITCKISLSL